MDDRYKEDLRRKALKAIDEDSQLKELRKSLCRVYQTAEVSIILGPEGTVTFKYRGGHLELVERIKTMIGFRTQQLITAFLKE